MVMGIYPIVTYRNLLDNPLNRLKIPIKTHPFTCASYNSFEVLHLDHIGLLPVDLHGNEYILGIIDAFSRWVELFPTKSTNALDLSSIMLEDSVHLK